MRIAAIGLAHLHPEREVVAVVDAVVFETAEVGHQAARVRAVAPGVPAQWPAAGELLNELHGLRHVRTLGRFVHVLVVDPLEAVAGNVMPQLLEGGGHVRAALQRGGHAEHGERQAALLELAQQAPHAST
ncbi:hypothetical protein D9M69_629620 [compost metagenome]